MSLLSRLMHGKGDNPARGSGPLPPRQIGSPCCGAPVVAKQTLLTAKLYPVCFYCGSRV